MFADLARDLGGAPACVVVNAGINLPPAPVERFGDDDFRTLVDVNLVGTFNLLKAAANVGPYCTTKAAVESLVRAMAKELAPRRVRVNAAAPGPIDTALFRAGKNAEALQRSAALSPLNRVGRPEEVAAVVRFLASEEVMWIDGQVLQPNGGLV